MNSKKKTILITGASGFLGRNLIKKLIANNNFNIIGISITPEKILDLEKKVKFWNKNINSKIFLKCIDIVTDLFELERLFVNNQIDYVIHAAALKYMDFSTDNNVKAIETNIVGTLNLTKLSHKYNVENFIGISTDKANQAINSYGMTKYLTEKIVEHYDYSVYQGVNFFWSDGSVLDIWNKQIKRNHELFVTNFDQDRYYVDIDVVAKDLIDNLTNKNKIIVPSTIYKIKLLDLFTKFIEYMNYDKNKVKIIGDRVNEKLCEELINENYNIEEINIKEKLRYTIENIDVN